MASLHKIRTNPDNDTTLIVEGICPGTKKLWTLVVNAKAYYDWRGGTLIQKAMPDLSADDRELLVSGYTPEGWEQLFGPDEKE